MRAVRRTSAVIAFLQSNWWLLVCVGILAGVLILGEAQVRKQPDFAEYRMSPLVSGAIVVSLLVPIAFYSWLSALTSEAFLTFLFFFWLGSLLVLGHYFPKHNFAFRTLRTFGNHMWRGWFSNGSLYSGVFLMALSPMAFLTKQ